MARSLSVVKDGENKITIHAPSESERLTQLSSAQRTLRDEVKSLGDGISELRAGIANLNAKIAKLDHWTEVGDGANLGNAIVDGVGEYIGRALGELDKKISEIETRAPVYGVRWGGVWHEGFYSEAGMLITDHGSLWLCLRSTDARPGEDSESFRLIVKGDRDRRRTQTAIRSAPRVDKA
jgi:hypothetical protein